MKLYEAIKTIVQEFGKEIVTNAKVINVFSDYNAFEESKTFKVILKNLIAEGYMDQLMYVRDWTNSQDRIINNFRQKANLIISVRSPNENTKRQQRLIWKVSLSSRVILKKNLASNSRRP